MAFTMLSSRGLTIRIKFQINMLLIWKSSKDPLIQLSTKKYIKV